MQLKEIGKFKVGAIPFDQITFQAALDLITHIIETSQYCQQVVVANAHSVVLAQKNPHFAEICNEADVVFPDGMSIVGASKLLGGQIAERVAGPDFMWRYTKICEQKHFPIFLLGGTDSSLKALTEVLQTCFPLLQISGSYSPPFGIWAEEENRKIIDLINNSGAKVLWLGVSSPKQDIWIAKHKSQLKVRVAFGVGAAFDFHSGSIKRAPLWIQKIGFEWFFRLCQDPKRLWNRYIFGNMYFLSILVRSYFSRQIKPMR
jgi:N-acetylglucosaminyldiphosphoundecaprenol N-acetyl-beta-D-mannosaminyltransferase